jgi:hypothetical protein
MKLTNYFGFWRRGIGIKNKPLAIRAGDNPKFKNRKIINLKSLNLLSRMAKRLAFILDELLSAQQEVLTSQLLKD